MTNHWSQVNRLPPLDDHEAHLWRIDLIDVANHSPRYTSLLTPAEQAEASRRVGPVRDHFTVGRACVRVLLGNALKMEPRQLTLTKGVHGKLETPALHGRSISFNLAHSKNTLLIALRRKGAT